MSSPTDASSSTRSLPRSASIRGPSSDRRYEELPRVLQHLYSPEEYAWMHDMQKQRLVQIETEPEWTEP